jgi:demethoxyubiquinone hydroxylase (CLK1/Coq7/Cat5 family)
MDISHPELRILNFYRASELYGGLILGRLVERAREPEVMLELTRHSAEEVAHGQLWTETILAVGGRPFPTRDTYQARYAAVLGRPSSLLQVLALTQVFERRVYRHFLVHAERPDTHPRVRQTLERMLEEEKHHLSWVKRWLDGQTRTRGVRVAALMRDYARADAVVYARLVTDYGWANPPEPVPVPAGAPRSDGRGIGR